jgi:hypothetical protein
VFVGVARSGVWSVYRVAMAVVTLAVFVTAATAGAVGAADPRDADPRDADPPDEGVPGESRAGDERSVFSRKMGMTILFDDGLDGVLAVDLDSGVAARGVVEGQRAGDQQPRLWRESGSLIVGWGEIWAAPRAGGRSQRLGVATTAKPAVEPGRVWLLEYPGGGIGTGVPTVRLVELDGEVVLEAAGPNPAEYVAALGVRGGLALESDDGLGIWDAKAEKVVRRLGSGVSWVSDAHGDRLAWCEDGCNTMHVTDVDGDDSVLLLPDQGGFQPRAARFSPDGRRLALPTTGARLAIADLETGAVEVVDGITLPGAASLGWSPDGRHLFFASSSDREERTEFGWYDTERDRTELRSLPFGGALSFVPVDRDDAKAFFPKRLGSPDDCAAPTEFPSGRTSSCGFAFDAAPLGETAVTPITFPDGRQIELRAPRELALAGLEVRTRASVSWPVRSEPRRCCSRVVSIDDSPSGARYGDADPITTYPGADGEPVPYYRGSDVGVSARVNFLVFRFGLWFVEVHDVARPGDFEDPMTDEERRTWAASLRGRVDEYGYLVLEAEPPLAIEPNANAVLGEPSSSLRYVLIEDGFCAHEGSDTATPRLVDEPAGVGAAWCDPVTGLHVYAAGPADFVSTLAAGLEIRPTTPGFAPRAQPDLLG